jgi:hypothetical protein
MFINLQFFPRGMALFGGGTFIRFEITTLSFHKKGKFLLEYEQK